MHIVGEGGALTNGMCTLRTELSIWNVGQCGIGKWHNYSYTSLKLVCESLPCQTQHVE